MHAEYPILYLKRTSLLYICQRFNQFVNTMHPDLVDFKEQLFTVTIWLFSQSRPFFFLPWGICFYHFHFLLPLSHFHKYLLFCHKIFYELFSFAITCFFFARSIFLLPRAFFFRCNLFLFCCEHSCFAARFFSFSESFSLLPWHL